MKAPHPSSPSPSQVSTEPDHSLIDGLRIVVEIIDVLMATKSLEEFYRLAVDLPRRKLGVERAGLSILEGDTLNGTFGTSMEGKLVDERNTRYPLVDTEWQTRFTHELKKGSRWFIREDSSYIDWTHPEKALTNQRGWVVSTPLLDAGKLLGFFSNDRALTKGPVNENLQELLVIYCSLLSSILHQKQIQEDLELQISRNDFILREIGDGLLIFNEDWIVLEANEPMSHMLEFESDDLEGQRLQSLIDPTSETLEFFSLRTTPALLPPRFEISIRRHDKSLLPIEATCVPYSEFGERLIFMFCRDITVRKRLEDAKDHLTQRLLEIQEMERKEISSMLHDQLGQILTLIRLELQSVAPQDDESKSHLHNCTGHVINLLEVVRGLARSLRPSILDDHPIELAFQDLLDEYRRSTPLNIEFIHREGTHPTLPSAIETSLYRILQESMHNIIRHAQASAVTVTYINSGEGVHLMVEDDGVGMAQNSGETRSGIGLLGMRERLTRMNGSMKISSHAQRGTTIEIFIPHP